MVDIQPRMKEIQERYKDNPQQLADETMKLFK
jgi:membrane protein insertase Oxa1/YidC/SpoIIIJ